MAYGSTMTVALDLFVRPVGVAFGAMLLYVAFFLYEDEEGRLQNSLEELWVRISDRSDGATIAIRLLVGETSRLTAHAFDRIFGQRYLSRRAIGTSFCYGAASITAYPIFLLGGPSARSALWIVPGVFIFLGSLPVLNENKFTTRAVFLPALAFVAFFLFATMQVGFLIIQGSSRDTDLFAGCAAITAALILAIASDFGWILLMRSTLNSATTEIPMLRLIGLILINSFALAVGLIPVFSHSVFAPPWNRGFASTFLEMFLFLLIISRLFITATALLFLIVLFAILLHRLLWPLVDRSVYAIARHHLLEHRKALGTLGFALIAGCTSNSPLLSWFTHAVGLS